MQVKKKVTISEHYLVESAKLFAVLADVSRLKLLQALMAGPCNVSELIDQTKMKQGNVSKHLGILLSAKFLVREQQGNYARYTLVDQRVFDLCQIMCSRIDQNLKSEVARFKIKH